MKKQSAVLLLSTLVLMTAVTVQPANAFKFGHKKAKPVVVAPAKTEVTVKEVEKTIKEDVKKVETKVEKKLETAKPAVTPTAKPVVKAPAKVAPKAPVKK